MFNRDQISEGIASRETIRFLALRTTVVNDFQDSKVLTTILWRHNHRKFSDWSRNNYTHAIAGPESAFDVPLLPTHSSHLCCHEQAGWGRQNWVSPGCGKP